MPDANALASPRVISTAMPSFLPTYAPPNTITLVGLDDAISTQGMHLGKVLFLDFDGVLHPETCGPESNFCCLPTFCSVLRLVDPGHHVPIVISSMWRHYNTLSSLRDAFPADIASQIVGVTPSMSMREVGSIQDWSALGGAQAKDRHRQREILMWMRGYAPAGDWLAIDDRPEYFFNNCQNLFAVPRSNRPGVGGITSDVAQGLIARLRRFLDQIEDVEILRGRTDSAGSN
jgi:hypothetical protein